METLISNSLQAVAFAHHQEFHELDHTDPNWSLWYAAWLLNESEVSDILTPHFGVSQLSALLHRLDGRHKHAYDKHVWADLFATEIAPHVSQE
jgi:hypothetical protein